MRFFLTFLFLVTITGCGSANKVYWCGDHPCLNKKERKAYFEKNFTVEIRELDKKSKKEFSRTSEIMKKAQKNEKERIRTEKEIIKQSKINEKKRLKEEEKSNQLTRIDEKKRIKKNDKSIKNSRLDKTNKSKKKIIEPLEIEGFNGKTNNIEKNNITKSKDIVENIETSEYKFIDLVKYIKEKNKSKSYPDINDIPN